MLALAAASPLALILVLMVVLRWSAARAGLVGMALAAIVAVTAFGFGTRTLPAQGVAGALAGSAVEALFSAATILWIIFPALALYELQSRSGAIDRIRRALTGLSSDRRILALLIAWFFALFMEGAAGFGTPIALAAPLLVSLGFSPILAVALPLIGHTAGVSFGAVGTPIFAQTAITALGEGEIAAPTALLHLVLGAGLALVVVRLAGEEPLRPAHLAWAGIAAACFLVPYFGLALFIGPELPTIGAALLGGTLFGGLLRWRGEAGEPIEMGGFLKAALPYAVLVGLILVTRLVPPLQQQLQAIELTWSLPGPFHGRLEPLYHPGTMLLLGLIVGGLAQGRSIGELASAMGPALGRLVNVAVALVAMLAISRLMVHAGMIEELAGAAAETGFAWPLLAPGVGAIGTFVTGSATASNILLTEFQEATAEALGLPLVVLIAAQGFGAAVGNAIAPHNIITGAATVGLQGREGEALRITLLPCLAYAAAGGVVVLIFTWWW